MACHVVNPSTKSEDPMVSRCSIISSDISQRIPLTMRLQPLRMSCMTVTYAWGEGASFPTFEIPDPDLPVHYTTCMALRLRQIELSAKTVYGRPVLNTT